MSRKWGHRAKKLDFDVTDNGCFICTSHKTKVDKGKYKTTRVQRDGKHILLHRWIYEEMFGWIPEGMVILHTCDNSLCINPEHMQVGTQLENMHDMIRKGRSGLKNLKNKKRGDLNGETL